MLVVWATLSAASVKVSLVDVSGVDQCVELLAKGCTVAKKCCDEVEASFFCNFMSNCDLKSAGEFSQCKEIGDGPLNTR